MFWMCQLKIEINKRKQNTNFKSQSAKNQIKMLQYYYYCMIITKWSINYYIQGSI